MKYYSICEAAKIAGVTRQALSKQDKNQKIQFIKCAVSQRALAITSVELKRYMGSRRNG